MSSTHIEEKICVFACATDENDRVDVLRKSMDMFSGWGLCILGKGKKWKSFRTRMECVLDALQKTKKDKIVLCIDAYDVLCVQDANDFREVFRSFQRPIVIGNEYGCFSPTISNRYIQLGNCPSLLKWKKFHNFQGKGIVQVNAGCIAGYAGELTAMFEWILNYPFFEILDDQVGVGYYMNEFPDKVMLDMTNRIFLNDNWGISYTIESRNHQLEIKGVENRPYFIHFPGMLTFDHLTLTNYHKIASFIVEDYKDRNEHKRHHKRLRILLIGLLCLFMLFGFILLKNDFKKSLVKKKKKYK